ncbi:hypothetical protein GCM10009821_06920 [Aeromicrobium halocynthiae]|uniref:Secreted protein n=1 Tax=Aeromicrobium halocynthiae TaxID=560557 RepID=A0ABN2VU37_9ACTN
MRRALTAVPVLVALLLATLVAVVPGGEREPRGPVDVPVEVTSYACPGGPGRSVVLGQVEPGDEAQVVRGDDAEPVEELLDPRVARSADTGRADLLVRQSGAGSGAVGHTGARRGGTLVVQRCPGIVDEAWFVDLASTSSHDSVLVLSNLSAATAVVDLALWGPDGEVEGVGTSGVVVEPGEVRRLPMTELAAGEETLALRVDRERGAVAAVVEDTAPRGRELLAAARVPGRSLGIGPLPAAGEDRVLTLVNPTDTSGRARVDALGPDGLFVPEGLDEIELPSGSVTSVALPEGLGEEPVSLAIDSDVPVTGAVRTAGSGDVDVVGAADAWSGDALVPSTVAGAPLSDLVVASVDGAAVTLQGRSGDGEVLATQELDVAGGTSVEVALEELVVDGVVEVLVRSPDGLLAATATFSRDGRASVSVLPAPVTALGPDVRWGRPRQ